MSGGAYEYAYHRIDELAGDIAAHTTGLLGRAQRKAFVEHLLRVAQVAKEVEWADSGDTDGSEATRMIEALVGRDGMTQAAAAEVARACGEMRDLLDLIEKARRSMVVRP